MNATSSKLRGGVKTQNIRSRVWDKKRKRRVYNNNPHCFDGNEDCCYDLQVRLIRQIHTIWWILTGRRTIRHQLEFIISFIYCLSTLNEEKISRFASAILHK